MLQSLHNTASSFFIKLLLGLLVASLALWGIGDVFRSPSSNNVVQVGDSVVSAQEFRAEMDGEIMQYRRMLGDSYSPDMLRTLGIPQQVLANIVNRKLVEEEARDMGIVIPPSHVKAQLRENPAFHGEDGSFNARQFKTVLANNGLTESQYVALLEKEAAADILLQSAFSGIRATTIAVRMAYLYENEKRRADVLIFTPDIIKNIPEPEAGELERYYEENAQNFRAAEHRIFSLLSLDPQKLVKDIDISDEDALIEYQARIEEFREPEKREVKQLLFSDRETAQKAATALKAGMSMEDAARKFEARNDTLQLGSVTASGMLPEAEQQVFALQEGEYSNLIQSSFGWHIFQVVDIQPERTRPFAEVKEELKSTIRNNRVGEEVYELSNTLQDDLAAGATLEEAARGVGAEVTVFGPISAQGTAPDGTDVSLPEGYERLLSSTFELEEGRTSNLMETDGGAYYAVRVDSIQPERTRALDEIKGLVVREWKADQKEQKLYQLAEGIASTLAQENAAEVASTTNATLLEEQEFRRDSTTIHGGKQIPGRMLSAIFTTEIGEATPAFALPDGSYAIAKVKRIDTAGIETADARRQFQYASENLRNLYADEFYLQYMAYLRKKHGVSKPNEALMNALIQ